MTITVSISKFRQDLSNYLIKVKGGHSIILKDDKKGVEVAEITGISKYDHKSYCDMLDRVAGSIRAKNHPEWATVKKVEKWLRNNRMKSDRKFEHVYP